jgi:hypothetical protein
MLRSLILMPQVVSVPWSSKSLLVSSDKLCYHLRVVGVGVRHNELGVWLRFFVVMLQGASSVLEGVTLAYQDVAQRYLPRVRRGATFRRQPFGSE